MAKHAARQNRYAGVIVGAARRHGRGHAAASATRQVAAGAYHVGYTVTQRGVGVPARRPPGALSREPLKRADTEGQGGDMASTDEYLEYVRDLLGELDDVAHRKMMGEYVIYYRGKVVGGIYDDRFLLKITPTSERLLAGAPRVTPYRGAKDMLLVETEDREVLRDVISSMWEELPAVKKRAKK